MKWGKGNRRVCRGWEGTCVSFRQRKVIPNWNSKEGYQARSYWESDLWVETGEKWVLKVSSGVSYVDSGLRRFQAGGTRAKVLKGRWTCRLPSQCDEAKMERQRSSRWGQRGMIAQGVGFYQKWCKKSLRARSLLIKPKERKLGAVRPVGSCCKSLWDRGGLD